MAKNISITVVGLDKVLAGLGKYPSEVGRYLEAAGKETGAEIIQTTGLANYPPATAANQPPTPFYIRGRGTQTAHGNLYNSERLGSQNTNEGFSIFSVGPKTTIGNRASYAKYVIGERQAKWMAKIGWRKLFDVAKEKVPQITAIYAGWVSKCIRDLGL